MTPLAGGDHVTREDVQAATDHVVTAAIEILDTRIRATGPDDRRHEIDRGHHRRQRRQCRASCSRQCSAMRSTPSTFDGSAPSSNEMARSRRPGLGAGVLDDPLEGIVWLARRMHRNTARSIEPGQVILSGSFIRPIECPAGTKIVADFGPFGIVSCQFCGRAMMTGNDVRADRPMAASTQTLGNPMPKPYDRCHDQQQID